MKQILGLIQAKNNSDPDNDGLTNQQEQELETDPQRSDTDNDGLNDKWESTYMVEIEIPGGSLPF